MSDERLGELLRTGADGLGPGLVEALPIPWRLRGSPAKDYDLSDPSLVAAIQAAMLLGQPLILAGEPGVGKTSLAGALAHRLGLHFHDPVQVKSVTTGLDLFYGFDEVARIPRRRLDPGGGRKRRGSAAVAGASRLCPFQQPRPGDPVVGRTRRDRHARLGVERGDHRRRRATASRFASATCSRASSPGRRSAPTTGSEASPT